MAGHPASEAFLGERDAAPANLERARRGRATLQGLLLFASLIILGWALWTRLRPVAERPVHPAMEVRQWSSRACGPAALATVLNVYRRSWEPRRLEEQCRVGASGCSLLDLKRVCAEYGLAGVGMRGASARALTQVDRPYIAYLTKGHFVVVERFRQGKLEVLDPSRAGHWRWTPEELLARSEGWVLSIREAR